jgi:aminopeptidase N
MRILFSALPLALLLQACSTSRPAGAPDQVDEIRDLPELLITADRFGEEEEPPVYPYRATPTRYFDLLHTALDLSFDWEKRHVLGKASLHMTPLAYPQDTVILDAVGFLLHDVRLQGRPDTLRYYYDGQRIRIALGRTARPGDTLELAIAYTARPDENPLGGSAAIRSDKGLYFINPDGQHRDKPTQIWTQGETQSNSRWFPTFDQPNERCTQEIRVTVDTLFETLSNGLLTSQVLHQDGTRTDTWRMDLPHAPYLFMLAIGDYAVSTDTFRGIPLSYLVEKDFAEHVRAIFPDAPAMIGFFSDYVGVPYPWPKYSQVVVRDYVSGAMENTTAVIYGEFMQATTRELLDERRNELIGAHELIHHWFGDLLTCESWSNLVLNEGFANYGEYLWLEYKYGPDEAEMHRRQELSGYLREASYKRHPLVDYHYANREDMFDAHSYNKGGLVLHMLRRQLGERVFRAGIRRYLEQHAYQAVEIYDLRRAMEQVSGMDLHWFFNQWFLQPGHPELSWEWRYDGPNQTLELTVAQVQDPSRNAPLYRLPTQIAVLGPRDRVQRFDLLIDEPVQTFQWFLEEAPVLVDLDPDRLLLAEYTQDWTGEAAAAYWRTRPMVWTRQDILEILEAEAGGLQPFPWEDEFWVIRDLGTGALDAYDPVQQLTLAELARRDPHSEVRSSALSHLGDSGFPGLRKLCLERLEQDQSYGVQQAALAILYALQPEQALEAALTLEDDPSVTATLILGDLYGNTGTADRLEFFAKSWERVNGFPRMLYTKQFADVLRVADADRQDEGIERLRSEALDLGLTPVRRFAAFRALALLRQYLMAADGEQAARIQALLETIKTRETDEDLLRYYQAY